MKKLVLSLVAIATISLSSFGQAPEGFKYQAVVRDAGNTILNNQAVGMQIEILQGGISGTPVYTESFTPTTNTYGLVNLEIGTGTTSDDFTIIDWANDTYFIRTSIDVTGGSSYAVMGTSQLMSVPYALHAKTADSIVGGVSITETDPIFGVCVSKGLAPQVSIVAEFPDNPIVLIVGSVLPKEGIAETSSSSVLERVQLCPVQGVEFVYIL